MPARPALQLRPGGVQQNSADPGDYGNYDLANRPADGLSIRFVVIHDTEEATTTRSRPSRTRTRT